MPNPNYIKGRKKEYKICNLLKEQGYDIVQRTAGSHSPFDIIAINKSTGVIKLIQSKPDNISTNKEKKISKDNNWLCNAFRVEFVVM